MADTIGSVVLFCPTSPRHASKSPPKISDGSSSLKDHSAASAVKATKNAASSSQKSSLMPPTKARRRSSTLTTTNGPMKVFFKTNVGPF